jgi:hypothetical protein
MKRIRTMGLFLVALFAMSAALSATASAEPEFLTKVVVPEGAKIPIKGTLGAAFLEGAVSKSKITCTGGTSNGEVTGPKRTKKNIPTFTGCETSGFKCQSGATEGVIITNSLEGVLGGITSTLPGVRLFPEATGRGGELAAFSCAGGTIPVKVKGSVIGSASGAAGTSPETGKLLTTSKLTFAEAGGIQKYTSFVEGPEKGEKEQLESSVNGGAYEKSGQSVIATLTTIPSTWGLGVTK